MKDSGDDRLSRVSTIMGPAGLTAVFGMGTGVAPPVWSPEIRPSGRQAARTKVRSFGHDLKFHSRDEAWRVVFLRDLRERRIDPPRDCEPMRSHNGSSPSGSGEYSGNFVFHGRFALFRSIALKLERRRREANRGGQAIGCWNRSASAIARLPLPAHRPGRLPGAFAL